MLVILFFSSLLSVCSPRVKRAIPGNVPSFESRSRTFSIVKGGNAVLDCRIKNLQDFVVVWSRGERIISANRMLVRKDGQVRLTADYGLEVLEVDPKDSGEYVCQIDVYGDPISIKHTLNVIVPPEITSWNNSIKGNSGDMLTLSCSAEGDPPPSISWTQHSTSRIIPSAPNGYGKGLLGPLTRHDAGIYICTAQNQFGQKTEQMTRVEVLYPPEVSIEENWILREQGVWEVELVCSVLAHPPAQIAWYQAPKRRLSTDDQMLLERKGDRLILNIERLEKKFFTNFSCEADNPLGKSSAAIALTGAPRTPKFTMTQPNILPRTREFNVSWTTDSFAPVTDYFLYYRKNKAGTAKGDRGWNEVAIPVTTLGAGMNYKGYYVIKNLENRVVYDVIVRAQNMFGISSKSDLFNFYVKGVDESPQQLTVVKSESEIEPEFPLLQPDTGSASRSSLLSNPSHLLILIPIFSMNTMRYL
ncbi:neuronal growth regulator 1 [Eurytemora carolleeae]|uniref:neuronal growth regulator 1 n=1 Tax=Eurytemora carolleeae TaxID=1294199 RepID=UPI000C75F7EF|nr:neuronal growth regulator 1 [Eurytemora carolleeae]|eukprot:XP_023346669.1 neuronal growth regulator 1-like [Eurytemora affinis]